jgi:hypothetical protein
MKAVPGMVPSGKKKEEERTLHNKKEMGWFRQEREKKGRKRQGAHGGRERGKRKKGKGERNALTLESVRVFFFCVRIRTVIRVTI